MECDIQLNQSSYVPGDATTADLFRIANLTAAPLAARYFNMRKTSIYGGTNEIQRNIISQQVLGL